MTTASKPAWVRLVGLEAPPAATERRRLAEQALATLDELESELERGGDVVAIANRLTGVPLDPVLLVQPERLVEWIRGEAPWLQWITGGDFGLILDGRPDLAHVLGEEDAPEPPRPSVLENEDVWAWRPLETDGAHRFSFWDSSRKDTLRVLETCDGAADVLERSYETSDDVLRHWALPLIVAELRRDLHHELGVRPPAEPLGLLDQPAAAAAGCGFIVGVVAFVTACLLGALWVLGYLLR